MLHQLARQALVGLIAQHPLMLDTTKRLMATVGIYQDPRTPLVYLVCELEFRHCSPQEFAFGTQVPDC